MKPLLKSLCIPVMLSLGACCSANEFIVAPAAPAVLPVAAAPVVITVSLAPEPLPKQVVLSGFGDVFYDFNTSELHAKSVEQLTTNANWIKASKTNTIIIEGNCDERGTAEYNFALGERRAKSAREYFVNLGVDPARLKIVSYGEEKPVAAGSTEEAWAQNRRVHFVEDNEENK